MCEAGWCERRSEKGREAMVVGVEVRGEGRWGMMGG